MSARSPPPPPPSSSAAGHRPAGLPHAASWLVVRAPAELNIGSADELNIGR
jgi:hypothetical protein